jgi:hypothetical protein
MIREREELETAAPVETAAPCTVCGTMSAPNGACLEIGACPRADETATRGAGRRTAKYAVPAAWSASGRVD